MDDVAGSITYLELVLLGLSSGAGVQQINGENLVSYVSKVFVRICPSSIKQIFSCVAFERCQSVGLPVVECSREYRRFL